MFKWKDRIFIFEIVYYNFKKTLNYLKKELKIYLAFLI